MQEAYFTLVFHENEKLPNELNVGLLKSKHKLSRTIFNFFVLSIRIKYKFIYIYIYRPLSIRIISDYFILVSTARIISRFSGKN